MKFLPALFITAALGHAAFVPDFKLKPDDYTVLMAVDAKLSAGLTPFRPSATSMLRALPIK
ncbi:MAG: hypothetical protein NTW21_23940 [Verrucomicrobia bacterium]|nr:hypothetical protein [Verrucomicrobiota bacterium]